MNKKVGQRIISGVLVTAMVATTVISGCTAITGSGESYSSESDVEVESETEIVTESTVEVVSTEQSEDLGLVEYDSELGYSMSYFPKDFELSSSDSYDSFTYVGDEEVSCPVYISVTKEDESLSLEDVVNGLVLQAGDDSVEAQEAYFGADGIDTQLVFYNVELNNGEVQSFALYTIQSDDSILVVEVSAASDISNTVNYELEEMLGRFYLK